MLIPTGFYHVKKISSEPGDWIGYTNTFKEIRFNAASISLYTPDANHYAGAYGPFGGTAWGSWNGIVLDDGKTWPQGLTQMRITLENGRFTSNVAQDSSFGIRSFATSSRSPNDENDPVVSFSYYKNDEYYTTDQLSIPITGRWVPDEIFLDQGDVSRYFNGAEGHGIYFILKLGYFSYWYVWDSYEFSLK